MARSMMKAMLQMNKERKERDVADKALAQLPDTYRRSGVAAMDKELYPGTNINRAVHIHQLIHPVDSITRSDSIGRGPIGPIPSAVFRT